MTLKVLQNTPAFQGASAGSLLIIHWKAAIAMDSLLQAHDLQKKMLNEHGRLFHINIIEANAVGRPDAAAKQAAAEHSLTMGSNLWSAQVIQGNGIAVTILRTMVSAHGLLSKSASHQKVFATVDDGKAWLASLPGFDDEAKKVSSNEIERLFGFDSKKAA